jgi:hypothetical protein
MYYPGFPDIQYNSNSYLAIKLILPKGFEELFDKEDHYDNCHHFALALEIGCRTLRVWKYEKLDTQ